MASSPSSAASPPPAGWRQRLAHWPLAVLGWARASRLRMLVTSGAALSVLATMFAVWSYLAHLAVDHVDGATLARALFAYDEGRYDDARAIVGDMQHERDPATFGGALFVLGAVKSAEADGIRLPESRQAMFLVAARYLQKALELGVPPARDVQARLLLGTALIEAQRSQEGIPLLQVLLSEPDAPAVDVDRLLVRAYLESPTPDLTAALRHLERLLAAEALPPEERTAAELQQAETLARLGRLDEAEALAAAMTAAPAAARLTLLGRIQLTRAAGSAPSSPAQQAHVTAAEEALRQAEAADGPGGAYGREARYWLGMSAELQGEVSRAWDVYDRLGKLYADTPEGLAAELRKAQIELREGRIRPAMVGLRTVLESVTDPALYMNRLLSLEELRAQIRAAYQDLCDQEQFADAQTLVALLDPLFSPEQRTELAARTHEQWGDALLREGGANLRWDDTPTTREGRLRLRTAGLEYEQLARHRFASDAFPEDLWRAVECYYRGHSFTGAARLIEEYLRHEVRRLNAVALLRLGQCRLASNQSAAAIDAFQECIEAYPGDAVVYQARLECARAYLQRNDFGAAEALLQTNLTGDTLTPESVEWRDTLFELGQLLYRAGRHRETIARLEEAIARYPDADQALLAQYTIARAYHAAADETIASQNSAKTESERQKGRDLRDAYLTGALDAYLAVQRRITLEGQGEAGRLQRALMRNCYMMQGAALYELRRWEEARQAFGNVSTHHQNDPFALESYLQIANCWRRLEEPQKARQTIFQAQKALERIPDDVDFRVATNFSRQEWQFVLDQMSQW